MSQSRFDADALAPLLASFPGTDVPEWLAQALEAGLGGVCLFGYNTPNTREAQRLIAQVREASCTEPIVTIDEEGGDVTRLYAARGGAFPAARGFGDIDDPELSREYGEAIGRVLAAIGVRMNFAPVADVNTNPSNPVIGARSFGTSPGPVARHARAVCEGLSHAGVLSCAKHFPGHGDTAVDSHLGVPTVALSLENALAQHVAAFRELGSAPDALMTGHMCVPSLGDGPATIAPWSYALAAQINPDALLVTDALDMGAITESVGYAEATVRALEAGAHLLCLGTSIRRDGENMLVEAHDAIAEAIRSGRLDRGELRSRAERVRTTFAGRASASACTAEALESAEAHLEAVGERASRRAVRWALESSPVAGHVSTAAIVDARFAHDYAAGKGRTFLAPVLEHRDIRLLPADPPPGYESPQVTFVLTRLGSASDAETARLDQAAANAHELGSRLIVLHTGVPETAPLPHTLSSPAAVLLTYGASRGVMNAAADLALREVAR